MNKNLTIVVIAYKYNSNLNNTLSSIRSFFEGKIIVVNNNVDKLLVDKVDILLSKYSNIHTIYTNELVNANVARNLGMYACRTKFIKYVDEDDVLNKNGMYDVFSKISDSNFDVVFGKTNVIPVGILNKLRKKISKTQICFNIGERENIFGDYICNYSGLSLANTGSAIMKTSTLKLHNGWDEKYQRLQDRELFTRLAFNGCSYYAVDSIVFDYKVSTNIKKILVSKDLYIKLIETYKPYISTLSSEEKKKIYKDLTVYFPLDMRYKKNIKRIIWGD